VKVDDLAESIKNLGAEYDERLIAKADEFFGNGVVDCKTKASIKKALDSGKVAKFSFCSADKEGAGCAEFVEKELQARVMGTRADLKEKASGKCPICGKNNSVVVYAGKSY
jgi:prolyl-tRNA synthetase